jgi:hypothetical protein
MTAKKTLKKASWSCIPLGAMAWGPWALGGGKLMQWIVGMAVRMRT